MGSASCSPQPCLHSITDLEKKPLTPSVPFPPYYDDSHHHKQVGMRHFHTLKNRTYTKAVNVEKLWSLLGDGVYEQAKASKDKAPVLDVTKLVRGVTILIKTYTYNLPVVCGRNGHTSLHPHM